MLYRQNLLLGALFILLSELMFASMGASVKYVTQTLPSDMAVFMRNLFGLALLMPLVWSNGLVSLRTEIIHLHLLRSVAGVSAMYCFFYALAKVTLRRLGRTEPSIRVVFYFALLSSLISSVPMIWSWQQPTAAQWGWLALIGLLGTLGQLMLTRGYAIAAAATVSPMTYTSVLFGAGYGYLFWEETLTGQFIMGALLIAVAGLLAIGLRERIDETLVSDPTRP